MRDSGFLLKLFEKLESFDDELKWTKMKKIRKRKIKFTNRLET